MGKKAIKVKSFLQTKEKIKIRSLRKIMIIDLSSTKKHLKKKKMPLGANQNLILMEKRLIKR